MFRSYIYIFENPLAHRVKVGITCNQPEERVKQVNAQWMQINATCQICGGRRRIDTTTGLMPEHPPATPIFTGDRRCHGSLCLPIEREISLAESHLVMLEEKRCWAKGTEKGSLTRIIKNLEKRIQVNRGRPLSIGQFDVALYYDVRSDGADAVETRAHNLLHNYCDETAPLGEVFTCTVKTATKAVEQALVEQGVFEKTTKILSMPPADHVPYHDYQEPDRRPALLE